MKLTLDLLQPGQEGFLSAVDVQGGLRLMDFGLISGTRIRCLRRAAAGSPILYRARGTMIALRKVDTQFITVEVPDHADHAGR